MGEVVYHYSIHEVLHMASFLTSAVDEELCEHDAIKSDPELRALAIKAVDALGDLYQAIGRVKWAT